MVNVLGVWGNIDNFSIGDSCLVAIIAILLVFLVLGIIILVTWGIQKGLETVDAKTHILPKEENKILDEDPDAVAALIAATIDFNKETGKEPEVISITKEE